MFLNNKFLYLTGIAYRNIYRNKRRTILCLLSIAIATLFIVFMMGFISGMIKSAQSSIKTYETGDIVINSKEFENDKEFFPVNNPIDKDVNELISNIKKMPDVKNVFPRITCMATLTDNNIKHAVIWGIDTKNEFDTNYFNLKNKNNGIVEGRFPQDMANECAIGKELSKKLNLSVNQRIQMKIISSQFSEKFYNPVIIGIFDFDYSNIDSNYIIVPIQKLQKLLVLNNRTQSLVVYLKNENKLNNVKIEIQKIINDDNIITKKWNEHYFIALLDQMKFIYTVIYLIFVILASFLILNTILMIIYERYKEIGMMGSLGMTRLEIVIVFFLEAVILSCIGAFIGSIIGGILTLILSFFPIDMKTFSSKGIDMPTGGTIFIDFSPLYIISSFLYGVLISSFCTIFPSLKVAFIKPVEALRR